MALAITLSEKIVPQSLYKGLASWVLEDAAHSISTWLAYISLYAVSSGKTRVFVLEFPARLI